MEQLKQMIRQSEDRKGCQEKKYQTKFSRLSVLTEAFQPVKEQF